MWFPVVDSIDVLLTVKDRYIGLKSPYSHFFLIKYRVVFNGLTHCHAFHREECDLGVSGLWIMGGIETFSGRIEKTGGMRGWETADKLKALRGNALGKGGGQGLLGSDRGHKVISLLRKELAVKSRSGSPLKEILLSFTVPRCPHIGTHMDTNVECTHMHTAVKYTATQSGTFSWGHPYRREVLLRDCFVKHMLVVCTGTS